MHKTLRFKDTEPSIDTGGGIRLIIVQISKKSYKTTVMRYYVEPSGENIEQEENLRLTLQWKHGPCLPIKSGSE